MHEFSIMQGVFKLLEDIAVKNNLIKINKVILRIGKLRQVFPDFLRFAFENISKDTIADGAELIIEEIPITMRCKSCNQEFTVEHHTYVCPVCGAVKLELLTGKEVLIASVEGEDGG
ncbi:MAG: hydrogenase maturation nickel metallochaperone HypA [Gammaproteobacteria bacterium]